MPEALHAAIELHDTTLAAIIRAEDAVTVRFSPAYVHRSAGRPGWDEGIGEAQECVLSFPGGQVEGEIGAMPATVWGGELLLGTRVHPNMIALPLDVVDEAVALTLRLSPDHRKVAISGTALTVRADGEARYIERFHP